MGEECAFVHIMNRVGMVIFIGISIIIPASMLFVGIGIPLLFAYLKIPLWLSITLGLCHFLLFLFMKFRSEIELLIFIVPLFSLVVFFAIYQEPKAPITFYLMMVACSALGFAYRKWFEANPSSVSIV